MSFILDALKKAEAEKDPDLRASLAIGSQVNRRQRIIQYLIIAALLGNLVASITVQQLATTGTARRDQLPERLQAWHAQRSG